MKFEYHLNYELMKMAPTEELRWYLLEIQNIIHGLECAQNILERE